MTTQDIKIINARVRSLPESFVEITIQDGRITHMGASLNFDADQVIDARGNLVTESFANPHLHLCKAYTLPMMDQHALHNYHEAGMGKAMSAIELAARVKENYNAEWIIKNVRKALAHAAVYGNTHIRAFADVDSKAKLEGIQALLVAKQEFAGIVDLQVVAFAQDGIIREPGAKELLINSMDLGADIVGGIPWIEFTDADIREHIQVIFDIAQKYDKDVSMLVDDAGDPGLRSLELMAVEAIRRGWQGRVLAHHARAQALYPTPYLQKIAALMNQAKMGLVTDPHTGPLHARVKELLAEDVLICLGQDDISDAYYPFGRNNMIEVAFLASHLLWMTTTAEIETLYDMITSRAFKAIGIHTSEIQVGAPANLVVLDQDNLIDVLRYHHPPMQVISHGKLIDKAAMMEMAEM